ncbi:MAG: ArgE/DapE family deacylase [Jiangellaceae bacterium]
MTLSPTERRVVEAVDVDAIVADLAALVAFPSVGGSAGEIAVQRWCAERLAALGAEVDLWAIDLPALRGSPGYPGEEVVRDEALGCVGTFGGSAPALILAGHTDVVPPGDLGAWTSDPWHLREEGGLLYGRGACDMKGGLAAALGAISALRVTGVRLQRSLAVHCVVGEEDGGIGAYATLQRGHGGDACVIAEPSDATVVAANAGSLTFRIEVPGRAAHGSTRTEGVSAIDAAGPVLAALRDLERRRNRDADPSLAHLEIAHPLSIGVIRAGDWASTVPDLLVAEGRYGVRIGEPVERARTEFESTVAAACDRDPWLSSHPARVSWPGGVFASGRLPDGHRLLDDVRSACTDAAQWRPETRGAPSGSDLRLYAAAGIPTVLLGPGDLATAHAADEHVALADLLDCARAYALLALRYCG